MYTPNCRGTQNGNSGRGPDGVLYYLPFETLARSGGGRYLVEDFQITYAPSATVYGDLLNVRRAGRSWDRRELLAFADPLFSAPGDGNDAQQPLNELVRSVYKSGGISFAQLPNTRKEARSIAELYPPSKRTVYLGRDATEAAVKHEKLTDIACSISPLTPSLMSWCQPGPASTLLSSRRARPGSGSS